MKNLRFFFAVTLAVLFISTAVFASTPVKKQKQLSENAVENLIAGMNSENFGLQMSSAYMLGEYKCQKAVLPLLKVLKSDVREEARITAALALYKIDDSRGIFAVKQAIRFDDSERVKKICSLLYQEHSRPGREQYETLAAW
jgi:HEAT repeat protein